MILKDIAYEVVQDDDAVSRYGVIRREVSAFACTSRGQAARIAKWVLYTEKYERSVVGFSSGLDAGQSIRPGQVIMISDPAVAGSRLAGRIKSSTIDTVTVDNTEDTDLDATNNPTLSVILSDGSVEQNLLVELWCCYYSIFRFFICSKMQNSVWILSNTTLQTTQWRVVSVTEDKDNYAIIGTAYNSGKFAFIEDGSPLPVRNVTILNALKDAPTDLTATQQFYVENQKAKVKLFLIMKLFKVSVNIGFNIEKTMETLSAPLLLELTLQYLMQVKVLMNLEYSV